MAYLSVDVCHKLYEIVDGETINQFLHTNNVKLVVAMYDPMEQHPLIEFSFENVPHNLFNIGKYDIILYTIIPHISSPDPMTSHDHPTHHKKIIELQTYHSDGKSHTKLFDLSEFETYISSLIYKLQATEMCYIDTRNIINNTELLKITYKHVCVYDVDEGVSNKMTVIGLDYRSASWNIFTNDDRYKPKLGNAYDPYCRVVVSDDTDAQKEFVKCMTQRNKKSALDTVIYLSDSKDYHESVDDTLVIYRNKNRVSFFK